MKDLETSDPKAHAANIRSEIEKLTEHIRRDIKKVEDGRAKALFETSAEVLKGLGTAFKHFEEGKEEAWK